VIGPEGMEKLCRDLKVDPEDRVVLVMAWHLDAKRMGYFTRDEFLQGFNKLEVDSIVGIRQQFDRFEKELQEMSTLKEIHRFAFFFAKDPLQRCLSAMAITNQPPSQKISRSVGRMIRSTETNHDTDIETAGQLLGLLLGDQFAHAKYFATFLGEQTNYKVMNIDQWTVFMDFATTVDANLSGYDPQKAWPVMFDDYVEWRSAQQPCL